MCKVIYIKEYINKKAERINKNRQYTLDELLIKFDELEQNQSIYNLLDDEEIEQLLAQVEELELPF